MCSRRHCQWMCSALSTKLCLCLCCFCDRHYVVIFIAPTIQIVTNDSSCFLIFNELYGQQSNANSSVSLVFCLLSVQSMYFVLYIRFILFYASLLYLPLQFSSDFSHEFGRILFFLFHCLIEFAVRMFCAAQFLLLPQIFLCLLFRTFSVHFEWHFYSQIHKVRFLSECARSKREGISFTFTILLLLFVSLAKNVCVCVCLPRCDHELR